MPSALLIQFLITVALCMVGIVTLALLFVILSPWFQRTFEVLLKALTSNNRS